MDLERLKREEEEAIKEWEGAKSEEEVKPVDSEEDEGDDESTDEVLTVNDDDFNDESTDEVITDQDEDESDETEVDKKSRVSWKKRYANYKASTDQTIFRLRQTVADRAANIAELEEKIEELEEKFNTLKSEALEKVDPFEGLITPEDEELIGPEAVEIIKKIAGNKPKDDRYDELLKKVKQMEKEKREKAKAEAKGLQVESMNQLKKVLTKLVPDWQRIDVEKPFEAYMKDVDPVSGRLRSELFSTAIANRDVERVASFYSNYQSLKPKSKKDILASKVTPVGSKASRSDDSGKESEKMYSMEEYSKFMDDVAKGKYRHTKELREKAKKIERQFDRAYADGRLR